MFKNNLGCLYCLCDLSKSVINYFKNCWNPPNTQGKVYKLKVD